MKKVEAEGGELILRSGNGSYAVIPKYLGGRVRSLLEQEDYEGIDQIVNTLPLEEDYAEDGTLMLPTKKKNPTDPPAGSQGLNAPPMFQPSDKTKWFSTSAGLSKYKGLVGAEADDFILGYYSNEDYGPYKKGTHEEYVKTNKILPIRKRDLPGLKERGLELPVDYEALLEGTGQSQSQNVASTNQFKTGGYVKAADGLKIPKQENKVNVPKYRTPLEELPEDFTKEFGEDIVTLPKSASLRKSDIESTVNAWNTSGREWFNNYTGAFNDKGKPVEKFEGAPYADSQGCLGSACRAQSIINPDLPSYYSIRDKNLKGAKIRTGQSGYLNNNDFPGLDSWELPSIAEHFGFGKTLLKPSVKKSDYLNKAKTEIDEERAGEFYESIEKSRNEFAKTWDNVPIGTIFNTGDADTGMTYTNSGDKISIERTEKGKTIKENIGEQAIRTRHSLTSVGIDENGDHIMYDYGNVYSVGNSGKADYYPEDFMKEKDVYYATALNEHQSWDKAKIERAKKHNRNVEYAKKSGINK
jgi:hypothetical protein